MSISSLSFNAATRATILKLQKELKDATLEQSGRLADVGLELGRLTGEAVQYHSQESSIKKMLDSNALVTNRLEVMDKTLTALRESAKTVSGNLTTFSNTLENAVAVTAVKDTARASLEAMMGALNINVTGQFLFAGAQTDQTPMKDAGSSVAASFQTFLTALGTASGTTVTAETVTAADLDQYFSSTGRTVGGVTYKFDDAFNDANWDDWSSGSDTPVVSRISKNETIESSLTTNEQAFRKITAAYSLINNLGIEKMGAAARGSVAKAAIDRLNKGTDGLTALQAQVGTRINRVSLANEALGTQKDLIEASIDRLEGVDTFEAIQRVSALDIQLQATYRVTGQLKGLSLLNYL